MCCQISPPNDVVSIWGRKRKKKGLIYIYIYKYIYICMDEENYGLYIIMWLFIQVALSHNPLLRVLEVHINGIRGITIHITESKIHISYLKKTWFDSSCSASIAISYRRFSESYKSYIYFSYILRACRWSVTRLPWLSSISSVNSIHTN